MKKSRLSLVSLCVLSSLSLLGCSNEDAAIDLVKESPVQYANMKMGKMLDTTTLCSKPTWTYHETERGEQFVKYQCVANIDTAAINQSASLAVKAEQGKMENQIKKLSGYITSEELHIQDLTKQSEEILQSIKEKENQIQLVSNAKLEDVVPVFEISGLTLNPIPGAYTRAFIFGVPSEKWGETFTETTLGEVAVVGNVTKMRSEWVAKEYAQKNSYIFRIFQTAKADGSVVQKIRQAPNSEKRAIWSQLAPKYMNEYIEESKTDFVQESQYQINVLRQTNNALQNNISKIKEDNQKRQEAIQKLEEKIKSASSVWGNLQSAELYIRFDVNMDEEKVVDTRGPRSGYILTWKDGTKLDQFGMSMAVPFYIETSAVKNDIKQIQRWQTNLSNSRTLQKLYGLGQKPSK